MLVVSTMETLPMKAKRHKESSLNKDAAPLPRDTSRTPSCSLSAAPPWANHKLYSSWRVVTSASMTKASSGHWSWGITSFMSTCDIFSVPYFFVSDRPFFHMCLRRVPISQPSQITNHKFTTVSHKHKLDMGMLQCYLNLPDTPHLDENPLNYAHICELQQ